MQLIDFDARFDAFLRDWIQRQDLDASKPEEMQKLEEALPEIYEEFLNTPAPWLQNLAPGEYFERFEDPGVLCRLLERYVLEEVPVPDLLLSRIADLGEEAEPKLNAFILDESTTEELKMLAISLLRELGSLYPMDSYILWQLDREDKDALCDAAIESLEDMGEKAIAPMKEALSVANDLGKEALLSVLSRYPSDESVFETLCDLFLRHKERQAILAAYLGRLGDSRALPLLLERAEDEDLKYLDYIELRSAIECLGGEAPPHEFFDDAEYEALSAIQ